MLFVHLIGAPPVPASHGHIFSFFSPSLPLVTFSQSRLYFAVISLYTTRLGAHCVFGAGGPCPIVGSESASWERNLGQIQERRETYHPLYV